MTLPTPMPVRCWAVEFQRLHPDAILPTRATYGSVGLDLHACFDGAAYENAERRGLVVHIDGSLRPHAIVLPPGERLLVRTGWAVAIGRGFEGQVRPRSGLAWRHGVTVLNAPGTIDSDYRGPLGVLLVNLGQSDFVIRQGDRIAQLVIAPVAMVDVREVEALPETERGEGGFGSTGVGHG